MDQEDVWQILQIQITYNVSELQSLSLLNYQQILCKYKKVKDEKY